MILRPTNEHVSAFQHGIDATTSDPYVVTDPDIVVPDLEPSWLARLHDLMDRHPDFGLIGIGLDQANRPEVLGPEQVDPATVVDGEIVEAGVGTVDADDPARRARDPLQDRLAHLHRRPARRLARGLGSTSFAACTSAGTTTACYPAHLASKHLHYGFYREMELVSAPADAHRARHSRRRRWR